MAASRFVVHGRFWLLIVPILGAIAVPFLSAAEDLQISTLERESVQALLGPPGEATVTAIADARFMRWLVEPGAVAASYAGSGDHTVAQSYAHTQTPVADGGASTFGRQWLDRAWLMTYRAIYRLTVAESWLMGGLTVGLALINDGAVVRRIRAADSGVAARPVLFHLAAHGLLLTVGLSVCALLFPGLVLGHVWLWLLCVAAVLCWQIGRAYSADE